MPNLKRQHRILCVCDHGNNRSVHFAHPLKYWGNDVLTLGLKTNSAETLAMLFAWADTILLTQASQLASIPETEQHKALTLDIGPDTYARPFNAVLHQKVKRLLSEHRLQLDHTTEHGA